MHCKFRLLYIYFLYLYIIHTSFLFSSCVFLYLSSPHWTIKKPCDLNWTQRHTDRTGPVCLGEGGSICACVWGVVDPGVLRREVAAGWRTMLCLPCDWWGLIIVSASEAFANGNWLTHVQPPMDGIGAGTHTHAHMQACTHRCWTNSVHFVASLVLSVRLSFIVSVLASVFVCLLGGFVPPPPSVLSVPYLGSSVPSDVFITIHQRLFLCTPINKTRLCASMCISF